MHAPRRSHPAARSRLRGYRQSPTDKPRESRDEFRIGVRHLDARELEAELLRLLRGFVIQIPANLQMVGDEADRADEHLLDTAGVQLFEVVEDVRAEPGLARRRLALERERPHLPERSSLGDELRGLQ